LSTRRGAIRAGSADPSPWLSGALVQYPRDHNAYSQEIKLESFDVAQICRHSIAYIFLSAESKNRP
jgi:hypothetical protein